MSESIDNIIKRYEPLMHKLLRGIPTDQGYEDCLQELRITVWQTVLAFDKTRQIKLDTFVHRALTNRVRDLLHSNYRILRKNPCSECEKFESCLQDCDKKKELLHALSQKRSLKHPLHYENFIYKDGVHALSTTKDTNEMYEKMLIQNILEGLSEIDKSIIHSRLAGQSQEEIAIQLGVSQQAVSKRLVELKPRIKQIIKRGA